MKTRPSHHKLEQAVQTALSAADRATACRLCEGALKNNPKDLYALSFLSQSALRSGHIARAIELAQRACSTAPDSAVVHQNLGLALTGARRHAAALSAFRRARKLAPEDPIYALFVALAMHADGEQQAACNALAEVFRDTPRLRDAWRNEGNPAVLRNATRRACELLDAQHAVDHGNALEALQGRHGAVALQRVAAYLDLFHANSPAILQHPLQRPSYQLFPGLDPRPYYTTEKFRWVGKLRAAFPYIRDECLQAMASSEGLTPYVTAEDHVPAAWSPLVDKSTWNALHFYRKGRHRQGACRNCPETAKLLSALPMARYAGTSPEAFFSILEPGAHIPPHYGLANIKLTVHLGLKIPPNCAIKIALQTHHWQEGNALIFDDSFLHEAWNRSGSHRAVLIFEVWHPDLTAVEIEAIQTCAAISHGYSSES